MRFYITNFNEVLHGLEEGGARTLLKSLRALDPEPKIKAGDVMPVSYEENRFALLEICFIGNFATRVKFIGTENKTSQDAGLYG